MKKIHIYLLVRLFVMVSMVCAISVSSLGGVWEVGASAISSESQTKKNNEGLLGVENQIYDDTDSAWRYAGYWSTDNPRRAYGERIHISNTVEDQASISIMGSSFTLFYSTAPNYGKLDVLVDNIKIHTINQGKSRTSHQNKWISPEIGLGIHELKFVHASGKAVNIDAIKVRAANPVASPTPGVSSVGGTPTLVAPELSSPTALPTLAISPIPTNTLPPASPTLIVVPTATPSSAPSLVPSPMASPTSSQVPSPIPTFTAITNPTATSSPTPSQAPTLTPASSTSTVVISVGESIQTKCINAANTGATCEVNSGTYSERVTISKPVNLICKGTCVVMGGFDISATNVTLRGFEVTGRGIIARGQYNTIESNYIHDLSSEEGILLYDGLLTNHITIKNNKIVRANNACIFTAGHDNLIEGNDCSATKQPTNGDADCFRLFGGNHVFRSNYCHDISYGSPGYNPSAGDYVDNAHIDCFQTWNWDSRGGAGHDTLFEKNFCDVPAKGDQATSKAFQMAGLTSSGSIDLTRDFPCRNLTFKNNVVHANLLAIFNHCQNITIVNNTFVGDLKSRSQGIHLLPLRGINTIQYNIFIDQELDQPFRGNSEAMATVVSGYNLIYRSNGAPNGSPQPGDLWDVDPQFVNPAARDYHLKPGSPACGFGAFPCQ